MNYEEYLKALGTSTSGYTVVQQRDLDEIYIKDDTGTLEVIKAALDQSYAKDVKDKMRTVSNAFQHIAKWEKQKLCKNWYQVWH